MSQDWRGASWPGSADDHEDEINEQINRILDRTLTPVKAQRWYRGAHSVLRDNIVASFEKQMNYTDPHPVAMIGRPGCDMEGIADSLAAKFDNTPFHGHRSVFRMDIRAAGRQKGSHATEYDFLKKLFDAAFLQVSETKAILVIDHAEWLDSDAELRAHARGAFTEVLGLYQTQTPVLLLYSSEDEHWNREGVLVAMDDLREGILAGIEGEDLITVQESRISDTYDLIDRNFVAKWMEEAKCHFMQDALDDALILSPYIQTNSARLLRPYQTVHLAEDLAMLISRGREDAYETLNQMIAGAPSRVPDFLPELGFDVNLVRKALREIPGEGVQLTPEGRAIVMKGHVWAYLLANQPYGLTKVIHGAKDTLTPHPHNLWAIPAPATPASPSPKPGRSNNNGGETGPAPTN